MYGSRHVGSSAVSSTFYTSSGGPYGSCPNRQRALNDLATQLWNWFSSQEHGSCGPFYLGGGQPHSGLSVQGQVFNRLESVFSSPEIDLFASSLNHRLLRYCSRVRDLVAWALDTFSLHWKDLRGYAFPPFSLISQVLRKIKEDQASLILVAPCWPTRPWFSDVLTLLVDQPLPLPLRSDLVVQPLSEILHPRPAVLHLTAWLLSGR